MESLTSPDDVLGGYQLCSARNKSASDDSALGRRDPRWVAGTWWPHAKCFLNNPIQQVQISDLIVHYEFVRRLRNIWLQLVAQSVRELGSLGKNPQDARHGDSCGIANREISESLCARSMSFQGQLTFQR
jgi:hypothetical protein